MSNQIVMKVNFFLIFISRRVQEGRQQICRVSKTGIQPGSDSSGEKFFRVGYFDKCSKIPIWVSFIPELDIFLTNIKNTSWVNPLELYLEFSKFKH